ncbi:MAG: hypothetical protein LQ345_001942 [Seirophora villosa]|nr:MAG: hypothetical protein LQ345_001942 [Seirophora villosa]
MSHIPVTNGTPTHDQRWASSDGHPYAPSRSHIPTTNGTPNPWSVETLHNTPLRRHPPPPPPTTAPASRQQQQQQCTSPEHQQRILEAPPRPNSKPHPSPFMPTTSSRRHPCTPPTTPPDLLIIPTASPRYATWHPVAVLREFNFVFGVPEMSPAHPLVLALQVFPLPPDEMMDHEMRAIALEVWFENEVLNKAPWC